MKRDKGHGIGYILCSNEYNILEVKHQGKFIFRRHGLMWDSIVLKETRYKIIDWMQ
jgi:hypothetical protein